MKRILIILGFLYAFIGIKAQTVTGEKLEISSTESHLARFYYDDNATTATRPRLDIWGTANKINLRTTYGNGGAHLSFGTHNVNDALFISNNGNIGINETIPLGKLVIKNTNSFGAGESDFHRDHIVFKSVNHLSGVYYGGLTWASGGRRRAAITGVMEEDDSDHVGLAFFTRGTDGPGPMYESMRITRNGRVGIGTTKPGANLHVSGNGGSTIGLTIASIMVGRNNGPEIRAIQGSIDNDVQSLSFRVKSSSTNADNSFEALRIKYNGNIGIGTTSPYYKLDVEGTIRAHEVKVNLNEGADYVFEEDYNLRSLEEVEAFVKENKHLPEIAKAAEMEEEGLNMAEFQIQLLQKIEELTLYTIEQQKLLEKQNQRIELLESLINTEE